MSLMRRINGRSMRGQVPADRIVALVDAVTLPSVEEYDGSRTLTFPQ